MSMERFQLANRFQGTEKSIWVEFSRLTAEHKALPLGQGAPDFLPPPHLIKTLHDVLDEDNVTLHQYARSRGHTNLVESLAELYSPPHGRKLNPMTEILPCTGAQGGLIAAMHALVQKGDEVIIIEPFFDAFVYDVSSAGGITRFVPLRQTSDEQITSSADWKLDPDELASAFNDKTKMIIVNTPHNPTGKVFSLDELTMIADLCKKHNVLCLADEVYEWLVYDNEKHVKIASLPDMWERTVTISSAGKTFSATGWRLGWAIGPEKLISHMAIVHLLTTYSCPAFLQEAVARCLQIENSRLYTADCYFTEMSRESAEKRDKLANYLTKCGMKVTIPQGGYFMMADYSVLGINYEDDGTNEPADFKFVRWLIRKTKLSAIPPSALYSVDHVSLGEKYVRFCFMKKWETIDAAGNLLESIVDK